LGEYDIPKGDPKAALICVMYLSSKLVLDVCSSNNCNDTAERRAYQINDKLIAPVYLFLVLVGDRQDSKPYAAEYGTHSVHAEASAV